jgi:hypothetical protein
MPFLGKFGRDVNKTFSKRNVNRFFNKQLPDGIIKAGDVGGGVLGGSGAALAGVGYLTGQPELVLAGKGLGAGGAVLKGSAAVTKGIQAAKK